MIRHGCDPLQGSAGDVRGDGTCRVRQGAGKSGRASALMLCSQANAKKWLRNDEVAGSLEGASICFLEGPARRSAFIAKGASGE